MAATFASLPVKLKASVTDRHKFFVFVFTKFQRLGGTIQGEEVVTVVAISQLEDVTEFDLPSAIGYILVLIDLFSVDWIVPFSCTHRQQTPG